MASLRRTSKSGDLKVGCVTRNGTRDLSGDQHQNQTKTPSFSQNVEVGAWARHPTIDSFVVTVASLFHFPLADVAG